MSLSNNIQNRLVYYKKQVIDVELRVKTARENGNTQSTISFHEGRLVEISEIVVWLEEIDENHL